jgi:hypothetical protein
MPSLIMVCKSFNPQSRIIQFVHIWCSCLTREAADYVCRRIAAEFQDCPFGATSEEVLYWVNECHPEAYPYATGVIGFCGSWITTVAQARELVFQQPYLYQGRRQFLDELAPTIPING